MRKMPWLVLLSTLCLSSPTAIGTAGTASDEQESGRAVLTPFRLYVSPDGSDEWDGLTPRTAVPTLAAAHERLERYKPTIDRDVEVRIRYVADRPYKRQSVVWTHTSPSHTISFMPSDYALGEDLSGIKGRPVFDADGLQEWFFILKSS